MTLEDNKQFDIVKKTHRISQIKLNHMNKVASTASPVLAKTPTKMVSSITTGRVCRRLCNYIHEFLLMLIYSH